MINFFKQLNPYAFIVSFIIGMIYCYYKKVPKKIVYRHPTPKNINKTIYHGDNNQCYKYNMEEVTCPLDKNEISDIKPNLE